MRVDVVPEQVELVAGTPIEIAVTISNTGPIIGGYHLRVLGADPSWVRLGTENLSLFPDTSETVSVHIQLPAGIGAGDRRIAVQVRELTPPQAIAVAEIELLVPAQQALKLSLAPMTVICGRTGRFGLIAENTGNTVVTAAPLGIDPERKLRFQATPPVLQLAPGEQAIVDLRVSARRRWFGTPVVRPFGVATQDPGSAPPPSWPPDSAVEGEPGTRPAEPVPEPLTNGSMVQKPRIGRGALGLASLLAAVTVFAVVITIALARLAGVSAADRDLALQVAAAADNSGSGAGTAAIGGVLRQLTDGSPAAGVDIVVYSAADLTQPVASTATADDGSFKVDDLPAGGYKVKFRGAGLAEVWYPDALTGADAEEITLQRGQQVDSLQVPLGGLPAEVSGQVFGDDVAGAVLTVQVPADRLNAPVVPGAADSTDPGASLVSVPIASDGRFSLTDIASPAVYDLVLTKQGYATEIQRIDLDGGESRTGVQLRLRTGDGLITGTVNGPDGPVGNAVITATTGSSTVKTVSLTDDEGDDTDNNSEGRFTLRGLITPASYTITVAMTGFSPQSTTVSLGAGQVLTDVRVPLSRSSGSLSGTVTTLSDGEPAGGVTVTVTAGDTTVQTVTQSADDVGAWTVAGLPAPGTYTVTLARPDLQSQTLSVSLDSNGNAGSAAQGTAVAMRSAFASVTGTVTQRGDAGTEPVGEAVLVLSSGTDTYTVTSASVPAGDRGAFRIDGVVPGTYTLSANRRGTSPTTVNITLSAGQILEYDPVLIPGAGISGRITDSDGGSVAGLQVDLYESARYPAEVYRSTETAADGSYTFTDVDAPQAYVVAVRSATLGALGSGTLVLGASESGTLNLPISSAGAANGTGAADAAPGTTTGQGTDPQNTTEPEGTP